MRLIPLLLVLASIATPVLAAGTSAVTPPSPPLPEAIAALQKDGAQMKYLGRDLGFDGWIAVKDGQEQYFYVTPDGSAFFLGVLFNKNGRAITFDQMKRLQGKNDPILQDLANAPSQKASATPEQVDGPKPQVAKDPQVKPNVQVPGVSKSEQLWQDVTRAATFTWGKSATAPNLYIFVDPLCPHCKDMLRMMKPEVEQGRLQLNVIMVGALLPDSGPLAAGILTSPNPAQTLQDLMDGRKLPNKGDASDARLAANLAILSKWGFAGTPVTVYRAKTGVVKVLEGPPAKVEVLLQDLR